MKTRSILITMTALIVFSLSNCGGNKKEPEEQAGHDEQVPESAKEATQHQFTVDAAFQDQLTNVFKSYVSLKEAFVSSDASKVAMEATTTLDALNQVDMKLLTGASHNDWMTYLAGMETALKAIGSASDIEVQREAFSDLSQSLYKSIKAYGLDGATAYYEFCPMAFDNQGGYWLSDATEIRNPYFGDKMLTCGSVRDTLK
ncbi:MAG TPA: DUF3347 domain-containing protein [Cyclobacteriaceae bacterium]|nr:DUF3347 domain-containing protein [Cyclobacteriaceae bacterium]